jgi:putative AdoMet-dependent methyltransferase
MRSAHADEFNHDDDADGYDRDVADESHPIRAGYSAVLDWLAAEAAPFADGALLDLGAGTGNLAARLPGWRRLECVDISVRMLDRARAKLAGRDGVEFVTADLLEYFDAPRGPFAAVLGSYAIHHLTEDEKPILFARIHECLPPGGVALFGDLMFESAAARAEFLAVLRDAGREGFAAGIEEEFFWDLERATAALEALGFTVTHRRFSELSWGVKALRPPGE